MIQDTCYHADDITIIIIIIISSSSSSSSSSVADSSGSAVEGVGLRWFACWILGSNPRGGIDVCW
jgi:hypothetical protein